MKINSKIKEILKDNKINYNDGLSYLLAVYYDCKPSYTPELLIRSIYISKIIEIDLKNQITWNINLFEDQLTDFEWVKEYREMFKNMNIERSGTLSACKSKFKEYFRDHPGISIDEIMEATRLYLLSIKNPEYLITSHYFISKGVGLGKVSELERWIEIYRENKEESINRKTLSNTIL